MFRTELDETIVNIVNGIMEHVEIPVDRGLYIRTRVRVKKPESRSMGKGGFLHFVFRRPYHSRATSVWFQAGDDRGFIPDDDLWKNTSNHDSGWRSDGVREHVNKVYFDYCKKVAPNTAPCELETTAHVDHVAVVGIVFQPEGDGYHYKLVQMMR
jgi:hypothetical protein